MCLVSSSRSVASITGTSSGRRFRICEIVVVQIHRFTVVIVFPDLSFSVGGGRREILPPTYVQRRVGSSAGISICSGQGVALNHKAAAEKAFRCTLLLFVPRLVFIKRRSCTRRPRASSNCCSFQLEALRHGIANCALPMRRGRLARRAA